uniref:Palmitoyltransferase n=1 Tax=Trypanosoma congolense (strain IL3000) TaxID=1068625 RepID=G0UPY4_TRYCI|nr:conserved hypothetical protein [Trypanosoma congolense IL3000]
MGRSCFDPPQGQWIDIYGGPVRPRRSGFECPLDVLQMIAWGSLVLLTTLHFTLHIPMLDGAAQYVVASISGFLVIISAIQKIMLSRSRIEDPIIFSDLPRLDQEELTREQAPAGREPCLFCRRFVILGSKHCSVCDKCVPGFDHHCRWLNTCVGEGNYTMFCCFIASVWLSIGIVFDVGIYLITISFLDEEGCKRRLQQRYGISSFLAYMIFLFATLVLSLGGLIALGKLIYFHLNLCRTHRTTYEHVLRERARKQKKAMGRVGKGLTVEEGGKRRSCLALQRRRDFRKYKRNSAPFSGVNNGNDSHVTPINDANGCTQHGGETLEYEHREATGDWRSDMRPEAAIRSTEPLA